MILHAQVGGGGDTRGAGAGAGCERGAGRPRHVRHPALRRRVGRSALRRRRPVRFQTQPPRSDRLPIGLQL